MREGFTLVEVVLALAIIMILTVSVAPIMDIFITNTAKRSGERQAEITNIGFLETKIVTGNITEPNIGMARNNINAGSGISVQMQIIEKDGMRIFMPVE